MLQVAAPIWNAIAANQPLKTEWARTLFSLPPGAMIAEMDRQATSLAKRGIPNPVILAYQTVGPLLAENLAISLFIAQTENSGLRAALPEVVTVGEALRLAIAEYNLTRPQASALRELLEPL